MREEKKRRLEARGWKLGSTADFLHLSAEEAQFVELKVALSRWLRIVRKDQALTQSTLANLLHSSQSRVAKMEAGDPAVSLDLLVRSLLALGATSKDVAQIIAGRQPNIRKRSASKRATPRRSPTARRGSKAA